MPSISPKNAFLVSGLSAAGSFAVAGLTFCAGRFVLGTNNVLPVAVISSVAAATFALISADALFMRLAHRG